MNKLLKSMLIALLCVFAHGYAMKRSLDQPEYIVLVENKDCFFKNINNKDYPSGRCFIAINDSNLWLVVIRTTHEKHIVNFCDATKNILKILYSTGFDQQSDPQYAIEIKNKLFWIDCVIDLYGNKFIKNLNQNNKIK